MENRIVVFEEMICVEVVFPFSFGVCEVGSLLVLFGV